MSEYKEKKVKVVVRSSNCCHYKQGDTIYFDHSMIDKERSGNLCMTALISIYQFIYAARKGITAEQMNFSELCFQCPDIDEAVKFEIIPYDEEE